MRTLQTHAPGEITVTISAHPGADYCGTVGQTDVAAGRLERIRQGALLKTLGATRRQIERMMLAEYVTLGLLAALVGRTRSDNR